METKIRGIMYEPLEKRVDYFSERLGVPVTVPVELTECFLVRHCLVHNDSRVGEELRRRIGTRRFSSVGKSLNVTDKDIVRYLASARATANDLWGRFQNNFSAG